MIVTRYDAANRPPPWANDPIEEEPPMIEAPSHLIRLSAGRVRVLRLAADATSIWPLRYEVVPELGMCRVCGCTNLFGCANGCAWVNARHTLCSRCLEKELLP